MKSPPPPPPKPSASACHREEKERKTLKSSGLYQHGDLQHEKYFRIRSSRTSLTLENTEYHWHQTSRAKPQRRTISIYTSQDLNGALCGFTWLANGIMRGTHSTFIYQFHIETHKLEVTTETTRQHHKDGQDPCWLDRILISLQNPNTYKHTTTVNNFVDCGSAAPNYKILTYTYTYPHTPSK
jgi:hypothetical protein